MLDGRVLITGGEGFGATASTEIYDPKTNAFSVGPNMTIARHKHSSSLLFDVRVLIFGGRNDATTPKTNSFSYGPDLLQVRSLLIITIIIDQKFNT